MKAMRIWRRLIVSVAMIGFLVSAHGGRKQIPAPWSIECVGYYSLAVPGAIEYPVIRLPMVITDKLLQTESILTFSNSVPFGNTFIRVDTGGELPPNVEKASIFVSQTATENQLKDWFVDVNNQNKAAREILENEMKSIEESLPDKDHSQTRESFLSEILARADAQSVLGSTAFAITESLKHPNRPPASPDDAWISFRALINGRIVSATRKLDGTPQQTIERFLSRYESRKLFETPSKPGVCIPYAFMTGEKSPADIGVSMRLLDRPDVVVFFQAYDASEISEDARKFLGNNIEWSYFPGAKKVLPLDNRLKVYEKTDIDGQDGLGAFVSITRDRDAAGPPINNEADHDRDFGYLAYVPGKTGGKPGESFNLILKVERFGRFAEQPMSEKEFRELVAALAAGIHRRPGAWTPH